MRLFIAVNFDEKELDMFESARDRLRAQAGRASYSRRENLHLTLAFLGEQPGSRLPDMEAAMAAASDGAREFELCFDHAGQFRRDEGDICWLGAEPSKELLRLQSRLESELRKRGFKLEKRKFSPHLTLARRVCGDTDTALILPEPVRAQVRGMSLMLSERPGGKLTYTELFYSGFAR